MKKNFGHLTLITQAFSALGKTNPRHEARHFARRILEKSLIQLSPLTISLCHQPSVSIVSLHGAVHELTIRGECH